MIDPSSSGRATRLVVIFSTVLFACGDDGDGRRPLGASCATAEECASGFCAAGQCLDPDGDEDLDTLTNALEVALGTDPLAADSDGDGVADAAEIEVDLSARDTDGDGLIDALESATADADLDCVADELDPRNSDVDPAEDSVIAALCPPPAGVCAASTLAVMCRQGLAKPACELAAIAGYEPEETTCDGLDNDCDGASDEGCDPLRQGLIGHWALDGDGLDQSLNEDHGTVSGATPTADRFSTAGGALYFDDPGDEVRVAATEHPQGEASFTYALWLRPDAGTETLPLLAFGGESDAGTSALALTGERRCLAYRGPDAVTSATACAPPGFWSFLVVIKEGRALSVYLDGRLQTTHALAAGQDLTLSELVIGGGFAGALDDVRAWERALSAAEIDQLFLADGWSAAGSAAHPAHTCLHARDAGRDPFSETPSRPPSGAFIIDLDGDGEREPFEVHCDMELDGGGWTLAWVYDFTAFSDFLAAANAVTPIPSWPQLAADSPVSTTPPTTPTTPGAIDYALWPALGREVAFVSELTDTVACLPRKGSFTDGIDGRVDCRVLADTVTSCPDAPPRYVYFTAIGPALNAQGLALRFDGSSSAGFPAHDPCGENSPQHRADPTRAGGAVYLRWTPTAIQPPAHCGEITGPFVADGPHLIDPDGPGGAAPFEANCRLGLSGANWTALDDAMRGAIAAGPEHGRAFLFQRDDAFYRSPPIATPWTDDFTAAPGRWIHRNAERTDSFACAGTAAGTTGIGCADLDGSGVLPDGPLADGEVPLCQADPDAFSTGETCAPARVWVRENACVPDPGSLFGDGELDVLATATYADDEPCWFAFSRNGWLKGFTFDHDDYPPGGRAPSLRMTRPTTPTVNPFVELSQPVPLIGGKAYTLSFWAKADIATRLPVGVRDDEGGDLYFEWLTVTPEWKRYAIGFEAPRGAWSAMPYLGTREAGPTFWLDGLQLTEDGPSPCDGEGANLVGNGDFLHGSTCWWPGNSDETVLGSFDLEPTGGPDGKPAWRIEIDGTPSERWHVQTRNKDLPIEAGHRYRLTFSAKASPAHDIDLYVARFDEALDPPPVWLGPPSHALTSQWRTYTYDFVPSFSSADVFAPGANVSFDFGTAPASTVWLADVRVEKLEADPCAPIDGVPNGDFRFGVACWDFWYDSTIGDAWLWDEDGVATIEVADASGEELPWVGGLETRGIPVVAGHLYEIRLRHRADAPYESWWHLTSDPAHHGGTRLALDDAWREFAWTFRAPEDARAEGAVLRLGAGPEGRASRTSFDDVALTDLGPDGCAPTRGLLPNVGFDEGRRCWNVESLQEHRVYAALDAETYGVTPPSLRVEVASVTTRHDAWVQHEGLALEAGVTYRVSLATRSEGVGLVSIGVFEPGGDGLTYGECPTTATWQPCTFEFVSPVTTGPDGAVFSIDVGDRALGRLWIDDVMLEIVEVTSP